MTEITKRMNVAKIVSVKITENEKPCFYLKIKQKQTACSKYLHHGN